MAASLFELNFDIEEKSMCQVSLKWQSADEMPRGGSLPIGITMIHTWLIISRKNPQKRDCYRKLCASSLGLTWKVVLHPTLKTYSQQNTIKDSKPNWTLWFNALFMNSTTPRASGNPPCAIVITTGSKNVQAHAY
jgi:hypothetical protein